MFTELLYDYDIDTKHMLDEGTAVIYNSIHNMIEKKRFYPGNRQKRLLLTAAVVRQTLHPADLLSTMIMYLIKSI